MRAETRLNTYRELVDRRLDQILPCVSEEPQLLHEAMRYSSLAFGKRLRPGLCIAAAESVGGTGDGAVLDAACALELVHCFSLIHDDLPAIDNDDLRRGLPTCHVKFGEGLAILAGDALFALAFEVISSCEAPANRVLRTVRILSRSTGSDGLVGGEVMDILSEGKEVDPNTLEFIHSHKTGALIAASCEIGGLLGGGSDSEVEALKLFGQKIGLAFQIVDDLLNVISTPEELGKAAGSDHERKKATYPSLYGLQHARKEANRLLEDAINCLAPMAGKRSALEDLARYSVERLH